MSTMIAPGVRRAVAAVTTLALAATVAACSNGSGSEDAAEPTGTPSSSTSVFASPSASASETSTPSSTPTPEPELPRAPAAKDSEAGRRAFAEFVIDRWSYALATNDAAALTDLSPGSGACQGCAELAAELKKRKKQGWYVDFPGATVVRLTLAPASEAEPGVTVATATINVPASTSYFEDGEIRNENKAHKGASFEVRMRLDGKRYVLLAFRVS